MAKYEVKEVEDVKEVKQSKNDNLVLITKDCLSIYRKEKELEKYLNDGWVKV